MKPDKINMVYFIGAGGIGMSALARYFNLSGRRVAGYDLTGTVLTRRLEKEGIEIIYEDDEQMIPGDFVNATPGELLIVYTPAIPSNNRILNYFQKSGHPVVKRARLLGILVNEGRGIAVAGTHGKTSVCSLIAHILVEAAGGCNAFLGGITRNYDSNLIVSSNSDLFVVEADEYDRSFLQLSPFTAVVTSMDADHLDIYGTYGEMARGFSEFASKVKEGGVLICKSGVPLEIADRPGIRVYTYGVECKADYTAVNIRFGEDGLPVFDLICPEGNFGGLKLGVPGRFNVENAVAAIAAALNNGAGIEGIIKGLESFRGIYRRFDVRINMPGTVLIDDYAHHPKELSACISAVREIFPEREITGIFQPHLYSRTRDFADQFAESLTQLDRLVLLDIYPAREEPIEGVTSEIIFKKVGIGQKILCTRGELMEVMAGLDTDIVLTLGAGNIDTTVEPLTQLLLNKSSLGR